MELRHLRYFVAVAEEQNVTRAAAKLNVSQPPLSRQVRDLEEELDVQLLERGAKSVRLTEAGKLFLEEARAVLSRLDDAVRAVRLSARGMPGSVQVGYAPSLTVEILPSALREFERSVPGARLSLHDLSTEEMLAQLIEGKLQVALMIKPKRSDLAGIFFQEIGRYQVCLAMPSSHKLASGPAPTLAQALQERLITYTQADYPEYAAWLASLSNTRLGIVEEHDSASSLVAAIEAGRGVALVPESFSCFVGIRLKVRPLSGTVAPFVVGVATKRNSSPIATAFANAAIAASRQDPGRSSTTLLRGAD